MRPRLLGDHEGARREMKGLKEINSGHCSEEGTVGARGPGIGGNRSRVSGSRKVECMGHDEKPRHRGGTPKETEGETGLDQLGMESSSCVSKRAEPRSL